jgi:hypothetical protein
MERWRQTIDRHTSRGSNIQSKQSDKQITSLLNVLKISFFFHFLNAKRSFSSVNLIKKVFPGRIAVNGKLTDASNY